MDTPPNRRSFLKMAAALSLGSLAMNPLQARDPIVRVGGAKLKLSLNGYSFNDELMAYKSDPKTGLSLFGLLDFCAEHDFDGLDPTGYYFPGYPNVPEDSFINEFKRHAHNLGVEISGTGIRNDFANPDKAVRDEGLARAKEWIVASAKLGAPVLRLFAGHIAPGYENRWEESVNWVIEYMRECVKFGEKYGVLIGCQNHGDVLRNADQTIHVVNEVDSRWFGIIADTGNMKTEDPYADIARIVPYAVNWQVKESAYGNDSDVSIDLPRLIKIIHDGGYRGYIPIETLKGGGRPYNPYVLVPAFAKKVRAAMELY